MGNYHELSCMIGTYPDLAIFRCFKTANVRNLLVLQAEITNLEYRLGEIVQNDRNSTQPTQRDIEKYVHRMMQNEDEPEMSEQWDKIKEIRKLLNEYNSSLLQLREVLRLPPADPTNLDALRSWLSNQETDAGNNFLQGCESRMWNDEHDLTSLVGNNESRDLIAKWIDSTLIPWFYHRIGYRSKSHILPLWDPCIPSSPTQTRLDRYPIVSNSILTTISTVFASTIPALSIFAFYYVTSPILRLVMITVFTALFSLVVAVFADAKRSECFACTAAFAAVLVVFVGSTTNAAQVCSST